MYSVVISFVNGRTAQFFAKQFDLDFTKKVHNRVEKFTYKDKDGEDAPLYLTPDEVAGIVVAPVSDQGNDHTTIT